MRRGIRLTGIKVITKANGKRYLYRRVGPDLVPLPDLPENHPRFLAAYAAAGEAPKKPRSGVAEGSIAALCIAYLKSGDYRSKADSTRAVWRRTLDRISEDRGKGLVKDLRQDHIRKDVRSLTRGAAQNRLKAWRSILKFAVDEGWIQSDPSAGVKVQGGEVTPHRQWTLAEIAAFRAHWAVGTPERTAFEVIYWTSARCVDAVSLGWQKVDKDGWLSYVQEKTDGPASCPVKNLPTWCSGFTEDHRLFLSVLPAARLLWIVTRTDEARSVKGLSQWMSAAASKSGLPDDCTAHGLRKARAAALAEIGATTSQIGAWTGHASLQEIAHYTKAADQKSILRAERERNTGNRIAEFPKQPDN